MTSAQLAAVIVSLAVIIAAAHLLGHVFDCLRQPRLIGEILAGILVGPYVLGRMAPAASSALLGAETGDGAPTRLILMFVYHLGLLLLMFVSGSEARRVLGAENRRPTAWIVGIGTSLPFAAALLAGLALPLDSLAGPAADRTAVLLVLAIAAAVMSIPVISRIFYDLGILHTRFASLMLGVALVEDIILWAVLAIATALAASGAVGGDVAQSVTSHVGVTLAYAAAGLAAAPALLRRLHGRRWNVIERTSPVGYAMLVLLVYGAVAASLEVNLVFAAFLAGFGLVGGVAGTERRHFAEALDAIQKVARAVFIPVYFAMVGSQLQLGRGFDAGLLVAFLVGSSFLRVGSVAIASRFAGFRGIEIVNLAVAGNARGGPGIVLATVAFEAGIINGAFFTALVLTAVLTSQMAGTWLAFALRRGWPLLRGDAAPAGAPSAAPEPEAPGAAHAAAPPAGDAAEPARPA